MVPKYSAEWWARFSTSLSGQETKNIQAEHGSAPITSTSLEQDRHSRRENHVYESEDVLTVQGDP
jgi:hypothetical protein